MDVVFIITYLDYNHRQVPEMVRMRKVWEDYKLEYQSAFEKMQEEFSGFIQSVKQGQRLDMLPTANYSHPPPYPQDVLPPGNLNVRLKLKFKLKTMLIPYFSYFNFLLVIQLISSVAILRDYICMKKTADW